VREKWEMHPYNSEAATTISHLISQKKKTISHLLENYKNAPPRSKIVKS